MINTIKVICLEKCNSRSYSDPEWIIYDRGEIYDFYDDGVDYVDTKCSWHYVNKKWFIPVAEWREKQINSILEDE